MKKLAFVGLMLAAGASQAATVTYNVSGGNWTALKSWSTNTPAGANSTTVYDAGDTVPLLYGTFPWGAPFPTGAGAATPTATYGGSFSYDSVTGEVTGGAFTSTGLMSTTVQTTWWLYEYTNNSYNFNTDTQSQTAYACKDGTGGPVNCTSATPPFFGPAYYAGLGIMGITGAGGDLGIGGAAQFGAHFDAGTNTLSIFKEGYNAGNTTGSDYLKTFVLTGTSVVPVPAAVWLFGSALGLLGVARRKSLA
jgi:hypothetical protein